MPYGLTCTHTQFRPMLVGALEVGDYLRTRTDAVRVCSVDHQPVDTEMPQLEIESSQSTHEFEVFKISAEALQRYIFMDILRCRPSHLLPENELKRFFEEMGWMQRFGSFQDLVANDGWISFQGRAAELPAVVPAGVPDGLLHGSLMERLVKEVRLSKVSDKSYAKRERETNGFQSMHCYLLSPHLPVCGTVCLLVSDVGLGDQEVC